MEDRLLTALNNITQKRQSIVSEAVERSKRYPNKPGVTVRKYRGDMAPQNIYQFRYNNPITRPHVWDARPLAFILGIRKEKTGNQLLALNLHWIPLKNRGAIWEYIKATLAFVKLRKIEHLYPALVYKDFKEKDELKPCLLAIRKYLLKNVKTVVPVPFEHYDKIFIKYQPKIIYRAKEEKKHPDGWNSSMEQSKITIM